MKYMHTVLYATSTYIMCFMASFSYASDALVESIAADKNEITIHTSFNGPTRIFALAKWEDHVPQTTPIYEGEIIDGAVRIRRHQDDQDLLFHRFVIQRDDTGHKSQPHWVNDATSLASWDHPMPWPDEIKGVSNPENLEDLKQLGVRHVHVNMKLNQLLLAEAKADPASEFIRDFNGHRIRFDPERIAYWDREISGMTSAGINVVVVFLNELAPGITNDHYLVHDDTDIEGSPTRLAAFNIDESRGLASYIATLSFLAERYSHPSNKHGRIGGYIIGNEVDSHWIWHNLGKKPIEDVARHYIDELRIAWLAIRQHHQEPGVFASFTHSWSRPNSEAPDLNGSGKDLLYLLSQYSKSEGDFGWHIAHHPYPQNLFEPRYWDDQLAMYGQDSPMITFKNIEVLIDYLGKPELTYMGKPRRVILSEQGFHTPDGPDGEFVQAAALALSYHRISQLEEIEAYILHRHTDALGEGGLWLGLRKVSKDNGTLGEKKKSWYVFQSAGTDAMYDVADFSLEIADITSWDEQDPRPGPFPKTSPEWQDMASYESVIFDFVEKFDQSRTANALAFESKLLPLMDGGLAKAIYLHPQGNDIPPAQASWVVELASDANPLLVFKTHLAGSASDGVQFLINVNGQQIFTRTVRDSAMRQHEVDLSKFAGEKIKLTLLVDDLLHSDTDWAYWVSPAIIDSAEPD